MVKFTLSLLLAMMMLVSCSLALLKCKVDHEFVGRKLALASQGKHSSRIGRDIYAAGGNAVDVATALSFALAVERPQSTGLGGGGFMLIYMAELDQVYALDFREKAPQQATRDMFLDSDRAVIPQRSRQGAAAAAVPGFVAGVLAAQERFGKLARAKVVEPAARLAAQGYVVYDHLAAALQRKQELLAGDRHAAQIFLKADNTPYRVGETLRQPQLAATLRAIAAQGEQAFYRGEVASSITAATRGNITLHDLESYHIVWRPPVQGSFRGYQIFSMPPPSSGGVHILQMLNIMEQFSFQREDFDRAARINVLAQAMQRAYADRALHLGDSDFVKVPVARLTSPDYAREAASKIDRQRARASAATQSREKLSSDSTTHFSVIDAEGNVVTSTQTINGLFGAGLVAGNTGIVLNNEMDDFSIKADTANMFGALGGKQNSIAAGKRPLSSMSPTIVRRDGQTLLALGAPGGTRIITCVLQTLLNYLDYGMPLYAAVAAPRFHHQWHPDILLLEKEPSFSATTSTQLRSMGWQTAEKEIRCYVQAVARRDQRLQAVSDPRSYGLATGL